MLEIPRTLFLSWCSPDSRYAGGEAIRRLLSQTPPEQIKWCGLNAGMLSPSPELPEYRAFIPQGLHWRLEGSTLHHWFTIDLQARRLAQAIWDWVHVFEPQVLWVVPEMAVVSVAQHLCRISGLPVHATVHDAPESCVLAGVPPLYSTRYQNNMRRLMKSVRSLDCVSAELIQHMIENFNAPKGIAQVVRPTVSLESQVAVRAREWGPGALRRIGLCGSFRMEAEQWSAFVEFLGTLPYAFEFISFTLPDAVPAANYPKNVQLHFEPYVSRDVELVEAFDRAHVDACYLGVWNADSHALFGQTSLSSKLTTYSAAAVPVILHGREDAASWTLIHKYGAGVRFNEYEAATHTGLAELFEDKQKWLACAEGATALCRSEFSIVDNAERLASGLRLAASVSDEAQA